MTPSPSPSSPAKAPSQRAERQLDTILDAWMAPPEGLARRVCLRCHEYAGEEAFLWPARPSRRPFPWGHEDWELQNHFKRLGRLRKDNPALRLGDIRFFQAGDRHLGFTRCYEGTTLKIYCNRSGDPWEIPFGHLVFGCNLQTVAPDWLTLGPRGFCVVKEG